RHADYDRAWLDSPDRCGIALGPLQHRVLRAELGASGRPRWAAALRFRRINRGHQWVQPTAFIWSVANGGHDEHVTRACRRDVREALAFRSVARGFLGIVQQEIDGRPATELERAHIRSGIEPTSSLCARELAREGLEDDDRELEPL